MRGGLTYSITNGGVERIIQKTGRDDTLREVRGVLSKLLERGRGDKPEEA